MAPMVHQSELPFRVLCRRNGIDLAFTQMISAHTFVHSAKFRSRIIDWNLDVQSDRPLIVQLNGNSAKSLVAAGKLLAGAVDAVDLNLGCPQNIARRGNYGAYLLQNKELSLELLSEMVRHVPCPITAKIRIFEDDESTLQFCRDVEKCGVAMLTIHGRTINEKGHQVKQANWSIVEKVKAALDIPVVLNGNIGCRSDAINCLETIGVDGVMSSEALLENPKLFCPQGDEDFRTNYVYSQLRTVFEYISLLQQYLPFDSSVPVVKAHLFKMLFRFLQADNNHDLRDSLGRCNDIPAMIWIVKEIQSRVEPYKGNDTAAETAGFLVKKTWYNRNRMLANHA